MKTVYPLLPMASTDGKLRETGKITINDDDTITAEYPSYYRWWQPMLLLAGTTNFGYLEENPMTDHSAIEKVRYAEALDATSGARSEDHMWCKP